MTISRDVSQLAGQNEGQQPTCWFPSYPESHSPQWNDPMVLKHPEWRAQSPLFTAHSSMSTHSCFGCLKQFCTNTEKILDKDISIYCLEFRYHKGIHILHTESLYSMTTGISRRACSTTESGHGVLARLFIETRISNITLVNIDTKSSISSKPSWAWTTTKERRAI